MLVDEIREAQQGNQDAMLYLIQKYAPLLKHYSKKIYQEDAFSELMLAFIELIQHIRTERLISSADGAITNYIAISVRNAYISCIKKIIEEKDRTKPLEDFTESDEFRLLNALPGKSSEFDFLEFLKDFPNLTEKEKKVLLLIYYDDYSIAEIASLLKTSRQNVNQIKTRAQRKIRLMLQN